MSSSLEEVISTVLLHLHTRDWYFRLCSLFHSTSLSSHFHPSLIISSSIILVFLVFFLNVIHFSLPLWRMMLPSAFAVPFGSSPAARRPHQRSPHPSPCNWIQPPAPALLANAHQQQQQQKLLRLNQQQQQQQPRPVAVVSPMRDETMNANGSSPTKNAMEAMRQTLPFPDALGHSSSSSASSSSSSSSSSFFQGSMGNFPAHNPAHAGFSFNQIPRTTFAPDASHGAFIFSGHPNSMHRRKRKSLGSETRLNRKKRCSEEKMVRKGGVFVRDGISFRRGL